MEKILTSQTKIRFQDCDPFNHLNNSRYIDYMINAREDHLVDNYDLDVFAIARTTGRGWVVATNQIAYISPAVTMETVIIESQLINYAPKSLGVEIRMWDNLKRKLKAVLWTKFIHIDLSANRPVDHSDGFLRFVESIVLPVAQTHFDERVMYLKGLKTVE
jgi:thioesterase III